MNYLSKNKYSMILKGLYEYVTVEYTLVMVIIYFVFKVYLKKSMMSNV